MDSKKAQGLYDPDFEKDACGIGFIADLTNVKSHSIIERGIEILENLEHRGAVGAEANSGDGAGLMIQVPHDFFSAVCPEAGIKLPGEGEYGAGIIFLPQDQSAREKMKSVFNDSAEKFGLKVLGWRRVPTDNSKLGSMVKAVEPVMEQVFITWKGEPAGDADALDRKLFVVRKHTGHTVSERALKGAEDFYIATLSSKIICYKGMLTPWQVRDYFPDLHDERIDSALALVHSRFSTNTFPSWRLAQPFRYIAHNGEINTLRGNVNWMKTRQSLFHSDLYTDEEIEALLPIIDDTQSDSAITDNAIEILTLSGRSLPHVMMMMIPEVWGYGGDEEEYKRALYEYHATIMEPWDGPASIAFTDGKIIGATLDRNGLRPSRYCLTDDNILIMGSEAGVLEVDPAKIVSKGRLQPGKMFVANLTEGRIIPDDEVKKSIAKNAHTKNGSTKTNLC